MFGCERYDYLPDIITCAKGLTSGYSPLGAVICRDFLAEPFLEDKASFAHGITFGGHPVSCAVALANLDVFDRRTRARQRRAPTRPASATGSTALRDLPIVGDVRGAGLLPGARAGAATALRGAVHRRASATSCSAGSSLPRFYEAGLIARADDRGDPVVQLAPPLVAGDDELDVIDRDPANGPHRSLRPLLRLKPCPCTADCAQQLSMIRRDRRARELARGAEATPTRRTLAASTTTVGFDANGPVAHGHVGAAGRHHVRPASLPIARDSAASGTPGRHSWGGSRLPRRPRDDRLRSATPCAPTPTAHRDRPAGRRGRHRRRGSGGVRFPSGVRSRHRRPRRRRPHRLRVRWSTSTGSY